jgi:hypothetical protein
LPQPLNRNFRFKAGLVLHQARQHYVGACRGHIKRKERVMLSWVVTFLIIALVAGLLGFAGIAGASIEIAKVVFFIAIALFLISAVVSLARGRGNV